jgi:hypothetical protein
MSDALRESLVAARCLLRRLPLFFRAAPETPLRVLGIVAFDTLHVLRTSRPLSKPRVTALAAFLDFEGCANAEWDHKNLCEADARAIHLRLEAAGLGACATVYCHELERLEGSRPAPGGDRRRFAEVRAYREDVVRLSISTAAAIALPSPDGPDADDEDVDILCRILMQCQIVDDVLDYTEDATAGLPSFLTACASVPDALVWTRDAARTYATIPAPSGHSAAFPFRVALWLFTLVARGVIHISRSAHQTVKTHAAQRP